MTERERLGGGVSDLVAASQNDWISSFPATKLSRCRQLAWAVRWLGSGTT
jgi:hypothetical protein